VAAWSRITLPFGVPQNWRKPTNYHDGLKECCENIKKLLQKIKYDRYNCDVYGGFKTPEFILCLEGGCTNILVSCGSGRVEHMTSGRSKEDGQPRNN
jgi:hypothetical protein